MVTTVVVSVMGGLAFRKKFTGSGLLFQLVIASLVIPSILVSLGVGLMFSQGGLGVHWATSGFGAQLTWTLPFGLLIMFAVFNRFNPAYEEAARDQGATAWQTVRHVVLPIIAPSLIGVALFGFTLSLRRICADPADGRQLQHAAAGDLRHDDQCDDPGDLCAGHADHGLFADHHRGFPDRPVGRGASAREGRVGCRSRCLIRCG